MKPLYNFCVILIFILKIRSLPAYRNDFHELKVHTRSVFPKHEIPGVGFLQEEDDDDEVEDFDLADIMYLSKIEITADIDDYSPLEQMLIVDHHNIYRSNLTKPIPKGSDMEYVVWNKTLASDAKEWLKECKPSYGLGKYDNLIWPMRQGQNLYKGPSRHPSKPLYLWYMEYKYFFFNNFTCKQPYPLYQCDHVTQLLWADSSSIGCARKSNCFPLERKSVLVNCQYVQAGNIWSPGNQVYKYGWPCTRCELADGNICFRNLCISKKMCDDHNLDCECKLNCRNCAKPNYKTCRCERCKPGWDGRDCSIPCLDMYDAVKKLPGFCSRNINSVKNKDVCNETDVSKACRKGCGKCQAVNATKVEKLCCKGKTCPLHHVLNPECKCVVDCPSKLCLYPPSTSHPRILQPRRPKISVNESATLSTRRCAVFISLIFIALSVLMLRSSV